MPVTLYYVVRTAFEVMQWLIIARVLLSWVNVDSPEKIITEQG